MEDMFAKFRSLDSSKQDRILNAAMKEFAGRGYELASTNEIVKEAGISKGLLFHYFTNKKQLYLYCYDYSVEVSMREFYQKLDRSITDFIDRLRQISQMKLEVLANYPEMFHFIESAYTETSPDVRQELETRLAAFMGGESLKIMDGIDYSSFREDVDLQQMIQIMMWTLEKYGEEELARAKQSGQPLDYEITFARTESYYQLFKACFYKNGGGF